MDRFERGFADLEQAAASVLKAAASAMSTAKQLARAVRAGDLNAANKTLERLQAATRGVEREVSAAKSAWPFDSAAEEAYIAHEYSAELVEAAGKAGCCLSRNSLTHRAR